MNIATLIAIERSLLTMQLFCFDAAKQYMDVLERNTGMFRYRNTIKKDGNAFVSALEKEVDAYYKAFPKDETTNIEFNKAANIANVLCTAIQKVIEHKDAHTELQNFVAFIQAYIDGDVRIEPDDDDTPLLP